MVQMYERSPTAKALLLVSQVQSPKGASAVQILTGHEAGSELPKNGVTEGRSPSHAGLWGISTSRSFPGAFYGSWIHKGYQQ